MRPPVSRASVLSRLIEWSDCVGRQAERVEPMDQEVVLGEARHRVVAHEAEHGALREPRVEQHDRVGRADEPAGDGNLHALARALAVEEAGTLETHEAVLQRVELTDAHSTGARETGVDRGWPESGARRSFARHSSITRVGFDWGRRARPPRPRYPSPASVFPGAHRPVDPQKLRVSEGEPPRAPVERPHGLEWRPWTSS